jgi:hypothetical protein
MLSGGFLRRRPGQMPLGAGGMYQRRSALERPERDLFGFLWRFKAVKIAPKSLPTCTLARNAAKAQPCANKP